MPSLPKEISAFMEKYGVDSDELWQVHGATWVIKHKALERVANQVGIIFERPSVIACDIEKKTMVICVFAKMGERTEWTFGEASPANCKNSYFAAMTEKRAKDRCVLKLLVTHGALYSESEAEEFTQRVNPHNTKPEDVFDQPDYDQNGQPVDNIPMVDGKSLPKKNAKETYRNLQAELWEHKDPTKLQAWAQTIPPRVASLPADWAAIFRGQYAEHLAHLRTGNGKAA